MDNHLNGRVTELEELYSHQQKLLQELNGVVVVMRAEIDGLRKANEKLKDQLESAGGDSVTNERPPHY